MVLQMRPLFTKPSALAGFSHPVVRLAAYFYFYGQDGHRFAGRTLIHGTTISRLFDLRTPLMLKDHCQWAYLCVQSKLNDTILKINIE